MIDLASVRLLYITGVYSAPALIWRVPLLRLEHGVVKIAASGEQAVALAATITVRANEIETIETWGC